MGWEVFSFYCPYKAEKKQYCVGANVDSDLNWAEQLGKQKRFEEIATGLLPFSFSNSNIYFFLDNIFLFHLSLLLAIKAAG